MIRRCFWVFFLLFMCTIRVHVLYCTCTIYCYPASPTVHTVSKNSSGHLRRLNNIRVEENRNITWLVRWRKGPFLLVLGWQRRRRKKAYLLQPQLGNRKVLPEKKEGVKKNPAIDSINILSLLIWGLMGFFGYENPSSKKNLLPIWVQREAFEVVKSSKKPTT